MTSNQTLTNPKTICLSCGEPVPSSKDKCVVCGEPAGAPNVRAAMDSNQRQALESRMRVAVDDARVRNCLSIVNDFYDEVKASKAVINMYFSRLNIIMNAPNSLYVSFYKMVDSGQRLPEENSWDMSRRSVDALLFPHYEDQIVFASLTLTNEGLKGYGDYSVVIDTEKIRKRASVFEENTMLFVQNHRIVPMDPIPLGYRAIWEKRSDIAVAKLASKITPQTQSSDFAQILQGGTGTTSDFVEVHIYGEVHIKAIQSISAVLPVQKADKILQRSLLNKIATAGIPVYTTTT